MKKTLTEHHPIIITEYDEYLIKDGRIEPSSFLDLVKSSGYKYENIDGKNLILTYAGA